MNARRIAGPVVFAVCVLGAGCGGPQQAQISAGELPHMGQTWFPFRAQSLGITVEEARARDAAIDEQAPPPEEIFDATAAREAAAIWLDQCAACHGPRGRLEGVDPMDPMPRAWGTFGAQMGFFFGGDKMRAGIYRTIAEGQPDAVGRLVMPSWRGLLSREQMWSLVRYIEGF